MLTFMAASHQTFLIPTDGIPGMVLQMPRLNRRRPDWFYDLCQANGDLQLEQTAEGDIIVIPPSGLEGGDRESEAAYQLRRWAKREGSGRASGSNTGFRLPNGATRAPDASWTLNARLNELEPGQLRKFPSICPDFVIEILSPSDRLPRLREKMDEYLANGVRLGWLIDADERKVYVYRPGKKVQIRSNIRQISASPELPGFVLKLAEIWKPF
jgi:Uma2 family endonuclease